MRVTTSLALGAAMIGSALLASPLQTGTEADIGLINGERILEGSNIGRQARERLESAASTWQERIQTATEELDRLTTQREEQALTLNDQALQQLNTDIEEKQVQLQRLNDDARRELQRLEQQVTAQVNQQLGPMVERFAEQQGLEMIFDSSRTAGLLYFANSRDVTDDFLALVNAQGQGDEGGGEQQRRE